MSEMSVGEPRQASDPADILSHLPAGERELFLREYRAALDAAHEVWRYRQLQEVLGRWALVAAATSKPGYQGALEEVKAGRGQYSSLEEVIARRRAR
jgi:hypothetical protein